MPVTLVVMAIRVALVLLDHLVTQVAVALQVAVASWAAQDLLAVKVT